MWQFYVYTLPSSPLHSIPRHLGMYFFLLVKQTHCQTTELKIGEIRIQTSELHN